MTQVAVTLRNYTIRVALSQGIQGPAGNAEKSGCVMVSGAETGAQPLTAGDSKAVIRIDPEIDGMNLVSVGAGLTVPSASGPVTIQFRRVRAGVSADMLSTPITIDAGDYDSITAATAAVIDPGNAGVQSGDQVHIDVDNAGATAYGLIVSFSFETP